jgi:hypothetical protein
LIGIKKVFTLKIPYGDVIEKHQLFQIDTQANSIKIDTFTLYRSAELTKWLAGSTKKKHSFEIISDDLKNDKEVIFALINCFISPSRDVFQKYK